MNKALLALAAALLSAIVSARALAAEQFSVRFAGATPDAVCIVALKNRAPSLKQDASRAVGELPKMCAAASATALCSASCEPAKRSDDYALYCYSMQGVIAADANPGKPAGAGPTPRVLYLALDPQTADASSTSDAGGLRIVRGQLVHGLLSLRIEPADTRFANELPTARFFVSVLGGDYLPQPAAPGRDRDVTVTTVPRCSEREVTLPPAVSSPRPASDPSKPGDCSKPGCVTAAFPTGGSDFSPPLNQGLHERTFTLDVPADASRRRKRLVITEELKEGRARYVAQWDDPEPPAALRLELFETSFSWRRTELHGGGCPSATIVESSLECRGEENGDRCVYHCPARETAQPASEGKKEKVPIPERTFALPATVLFRGIRNDERWSARLTYSGEAIDGYVPSERRHLTLNWSCEAGDAVDPASECSASTGPAPGDGRRVRSLEGAALQRRSTKPGGLVSSLVITGPQGAYRVNPRCDPVDGPCETRVAIPGLEDAAIRYTYEGERRYYERTERPRNGKLFVAPPSALERPLFVGVAFGVGGAVPLSSLPSSPYGFVRGTLSYWFPGSRWMIEGRVTGAVAEQHYRGIGDGTNSAAIGNVPFVRVFFEHPLFLWVGHGVAVGLGPGLELAFPWFTADVARVGTVEPSPDVVGIFRYAPVAPSVFSLEAAIRVASESSRVHALVPGPTGDVAVVQSTGARSAVLSFEFGPRLDF